MNDETNATDLTALLDATESRLYPRIPEERLKAFLEDFKEMQEAGAVQDPPPDPAEDSD